MPQKHVLAVAIAAALAAFSFNIEPATADGASDIRSGKQMSVMMPSVPKQVLGSSRQEARALAGTLLSDANIRFRPLSRTEAPQLNASYDAVWKMPKGVVGMIRVMDEIQSTDRLKSRIANRDALACDGEHAATDQKFNVSGDGLTLISVCSAQTGWTATHMLLPRAYGGVYVITLLGGGKSINAVASLAEQLRSTALAQPGGVAPFTPA
ncbi:MAG: hypothetical protein AAF619_05760 [Pseudomonadota bacterium]